MIYGGSIPAYSWGLRQQWHGPQMGLRILHITCGTLSYTRDQIARTINFLIGNCPNLSDLLLSFYSQYWGPREFDGDPNLAEILRLDQVRSPSTSITRLNSLSADGCNLALTPNTVLQLQNLTHIEFLDNECIRQEGFWSVLCSKDGIAPSVRLKSIKLSSMDPFFLDYLHSYSGLESLELKTQTPTSFRDWGDLRGQSLDPAGSVGGTGQVERRAIKFYLGIEKHAETIQVLSVESYKEDLWCFGGHNVGIIGKCHQLRVLGIPMDSKMVIEGDTTTEGGENVVSARNFRQDEAIFSCFFLNKRQSYFIQQVFCHPSLETIRCYLAGPTEDVRVEAENKLVALGEMMMQQGARDDASFRWKYVLEDSASINSVTWQKS
ncbi:hypothetical protein K435DRAFT_235378 [Dendrothele bispora CBS 962.96]|uniref:RNI-like protein n=1 Tax=Dendrothele bispora (strain CBS 962.96) TaxID=1314807 RepID=A0A4S8LQS7_DENBC|nr:hypothetical protein K435DRAFT_235378 [Dendrothele bispora CBS 962.96]